jgi:hypothetical protein
VNTCIEITKEPIHVVQPEDVPNPGWLNPGTPSAGQQAFGSKLLAESCSQAPCPGSAGTS